MTNPDVHVSRLIRLPEVLARTGLSRSSVYARIKADGSFPAPVDLGTGHAVAWVEEEVDSWIAKRIARRDSGERARDAIVPPVRAREARGLRRTSSGKKATRAGSPRPPSAA
jgi:prophage regulatory protein